MPAPAELHFFLSRAPTVAEDEFRRAILALSKTLGALAGFRIVMPQTASAHTEATAHAEVPADALLSLPTPAVAQLAAAEAAVKRALPCWTCLTALRLRQRATTSCRAQEK